MEDTGIMRETVRSAVPTMIDGQMAPQAVQVQPVSWTANYLIQLVQALTTGGMVAGLVASFWYWAAKGDLPTWWWAVCLTVLGVWATFWTIVRFHGEETGLMRAWYRAGQRSRDGEVNALWVEVETLRDAATAGNGAPSSESEKRIAVANATLKNARLLLRVVYTYGPEQASRKPMDERKMGQRDWERARRLCMAAGVLDELMQPKVHSLAEAVRAVEELHAAGVQTLRGSKTSGVAYL
jgi:hypothetical protein